MREQLRCAPTPETAEEMVQATFVVVTTSILVYGATSSPLMRRHARMQGR